MLIIGSCIQPLEPFEQIEPFERLKRLKRLKRFKPPTFSPSHNEEDLLRKTPHY